MQIQLSNIHASNLSSIPASFSIKQLLIKMNLYTIYMWAHESRADKGFSGSGAVKVVSEANNNLILTWENDRTYFVSFKV